jgi:pullulanase/glycogen debranching enzyme
MEFRLLIALLLALAAPAQARPAATDADCAREPAVLLAPAPVAAPGAEAAALWLDATRLRWPGQPEGGRYRLLHAATGQITVDAAGQAAGAAGAILLRADRGARPAELERRFRWAGPGVSLALPQGSAPRLRALLRGDLLLVREDPQGRVLARTRVQHAAALDALYAAAERVPDLGMRVDGAGAYFKVWAPTAQRVALCLHADAPRLKAMQRDAATGIWRLRAPGVRSGRYSYLVDVFVPGTGWVRNRVTDPYAISLDTDSQQTWIGRLDAPVTLPPGWREARAPQRVRQMTDMVIYELHVRDFSRDDRTVRPAWRGKYLGFTEPASEGMRHLRALSAAGLTDVHLLPVFDLASVPERGCVEPAIAGAPDSPDQQAAVAAVKDVDCYNWGYDPWHYTAPEGSFATDPDDGAVRVREFRQMVMALHAAGLRVGMDVVYNHTTAAGQHPQSVLDRIVPGYYHRLNARGEVERSTCCDNTATEHRMMGKLMLDSVSTWARHYRIDSFRFDLMGHQPRALMLQLRRRLKAETGREIQLIGEGWNFGEVADGARFVQASQLELNGSGIATFSDRARDAVRGGGAGDSGEAQIARKGYVNGLAEPEALRRSADLVRVGLAGSLRGYRMTTHDGSVKALQDIPYGGGQPAGYVSEPTEVVNYVENHDNQTLFDVNVFKLPRDTTTEDRARVQMLAVAINMFSQGVAYFHAGVELLRSKSMDRNSYDSGDWFNRIDWTGQDNFFGTGLPPAWDNRESWPLMAPLLADPAIRPRPGDIAWARGQFLDLLQLRASTPLLRLPTAAAIMQRLRFPNTGPAQVPTVLVGQLDGEGLAGAGLRELVYLINVDVVEQTVPVPASAGRPFVLHPVHRAPGATDRRALEARHDRASGRFSVPARTAVVFVRE